MCRTCLPAETPGSEHQQAASLAGPGHSSEQGPWPGHSPEHGPHPGGVFITVMKGKRARRKTSQNSAENTTETRWDVTSPPSLSRASGTRGSGQAPSLVTVHRFNDEATSVCFKKQSAQDARTLDTPSGRGVPTHTSVDPRGSDDAPQHCVGEPPALPSRDHSRALFSGRRTPHVYQVTCSSLPARMGSVTGSVWPHVGFLPCPHASLSFPAPRVWAPDASPSHGRCLPLGTATSTWVKATDLGHFSNSGVCVSCVNRVCQGHARPLLPLVPGVSGEIAPALPSAHPGKDEEWTCRPTVRAADPEQRKEAEHQGGGGGSRMPAVATTPAG